ncbi:hypothetical protein E3N88_41711 [Mikania micrantha]|uniref:DNA-directed RNA polymerase n=1 Tax=Mikania micrantha TaxID=192012 RepID=A0A5N6LJV3_9ASTR|nr:hypothetical protein E3N88_41711 [Mikania micrantha]
MARTPPEGGLLRLPPKLRRKGPKPIPGLFKSAVKSHGLTLDRRWKLPSWSTVGAEGISGGVSPEEPTLKGCKQQKVLTLSPTLFSDDVPWAKGDTILFLSSIVPIRTSGLVFPFHHLAYVLHVAFRQATAASISLGIDDLLTIPSKRWLVQDAEFQ